MTCHLPLKLALTHRVVSCRVIQLTVGMVRLARLRRCQLSRPIPALESPDPIYSTAVACTYQLLHERLTLARRRCPFSDHGNRAGPGALGGAVIDALAQRARNATQDAQCPHELLFLMYTNNARCATHNISYHSKFRFSHNQTE